MVISGNNLVVNGITVTQSSLSNINNLSDGTVTASVPFVLNPKTITTSYTIPSGNNAMTAGPITVNDGVSIVVPDGSSWTIV